MVVTSVPSRGNKQTTSKNKAVSPGNPDFRKVVLQRALNECPWKGNNERVKIRGTNTRGNVIEILYDEDKVNWTKNIPHFIVVKFDDGKTLSCARSQLKNSRI